MSGFSALLARADALVDRAWRHLYERARSGAKLDSRKLEALQLESYELAFCSAELAAARAAQEHVAARETRDELAAPLADAFAAEAVHAAAARLAMRPNAYGLELSALHAIEPAADAVLARALAPEELERIGGALVARDGELPPPLLDEEHELMRETFAAFGREQVEPRAQEIHRRDLDIPESIIRSAAELGLFGVSIPQRFGGLQPDDRADTLAMIVVTESLSRASLGAAGSLVTRPEIMARALLAGGTEAQQKQWLPKLASGEQLCAISITEPDHGSDVAALRLRATRGEGGWRLDGAKTWCTFAGRAELLLVLARTHPDPSLGHRGLSLFVVEKPRFAGHEFEVRAHGGRLVGRAIPTLGYRGMHSFDLVFEDFLVPETALVGGAVGEGRGFYLTMTGFSGGRVQTAARANGVMQAALEAAIGHAQSRVVFGRPIAHNALARAKLARMGAWLNASRQFTHAVARRLDAGGGEMQASLVKFFACRAAEWVTRDGMQMHGGVGYAEETPASRLFVDARVLSIFEGAEETLALKVIARELIDAAGRSD